MKKFGGALFLGLAAGAAIAGAYHYFQNKDKDLADIDDFDDLENLDGAASSRSYVNLDSAKKFAGDVAGKAKDVAKDVSGKAKEVTDKVLSGEFADKAKGVATDVAGKAKEVTDKVLSSETAGKVKDAAADAYGKAKEVAAEAYDKVSTKIQEVTKGSSEASEADGGLSGTPL